MGKNYAIATLQIDLAMTQQFNSKNYPMIDIGNWRKNLRYYERNSMAAMKFWAGDQS